METKHVKPLVKDHRISTRVTGEHKALFEQAAALKGLSLTDFVVISAYEAAIQVLMESQIVLELGPEDTRAFVERILDARDPDELPALQAAIQRQKQDEQ